MRDFNPKKWCSECFELESVPGHTIYHQRFSSRKDGKRMLTCSCGWSKLSDSFHGDAKFAIEHYSFRNILTRALG